MKTPFRLHTTYRTRHWELCDGRYDRGRGTRTLRECTTTTTTTTTTTITTKGVSVAGGLKHPRFDCCDLRSFYSNPSQLILTLTTIPPPPPNSLLPPHAPTPTTPLHAMHPLLPLALLTLFLLAAAFIGYAIYATATEIAQKTTKKMESKNVVFSKDGMRVGVKEVRGDVYVDGTQRFVLFLRLCFWGWALGNGG